MRRAITVLSFGLLLLTAPVAEAQRQRLPRVAKQALDSAVSLLGKTHGDDRILACIDALPFLEIVQLHAPNYPFSNGLTAECYYLTDQFEKAVPALERYLELVPASARTGEVADKVERAELRLERARRILNERELAAKAAAKAEEAASKAELAAEKAEAAARKASEVASSSSSSVAPAPAPELSPPPADDLALLAEAELLQADEVLPPEDVEVFDEASLAPRQIAIRAGWSGTAGVLGLGAEIRLGEVAFALGSGAYPVSLGGSWVRAMGPGALYVEGHATWAASSPFVARFASGVGLGATVGYDWRPVEWLSVKGGVGGAWVSTRGVGLVVDACAGPVLSF